MKSNGAVAVAAALSLRSFVSAADPIAKYCISSTNVCYSVNVPGAVASSGNGDVFFQITAPTTYSWASLGQGSRMKDSNIFVIYPSSNGQNVTLSPRLGTGHDMPEYNGNTKVTLLDGSGIANGIMTANVRCSNCESWSGGSMDFTSSSSSWIYAMGSGSSMSSDDVGASISEHSHSDMGSFTWDLSSAKGGSSANPFIAQSTASSDNTTTTTNSDDAAGDDSSDTYDHIVKIHAVLACIAFVGLFPIGGILIRLGNFSNLCWVHAAVQILAFAIYTVAFAMGVWLTTQQAPDSWAHPGIGITLFVILLAQPFTGWRHHRYFLRFMSRGTASAFHLTIGRIAILLGLINGGLGLALSGEETGKIVAYAIVAAIIGALYIAAIVIGERRRLRAREALKSPRMQLDTLSDPRNSEGELMRVETQVRK